MHRREFICGVAVAVTGAPSLALRTASAQQPAKVRRIGVLMGSSESDTGDYFAAFVEELARLGWTDGRNVRIEQRWTKGDSSRASAFATELIGLQPDVIFCSSTAVTAALHQATSTIPIVFAIVTDPVGSGFVAGLPRRAPCDLLLVRRTSAPRLSRDVCQPRVVEDPGMHTRLLHGNREISIAVIVGKAGGRSRR
jgi:putative ABC transport system substrate-binding protein